MKVLEYSQSVPNKVGKKFLALSDLHVFTDKDVKKLFKIINYLEKAEDKDEIYDAIFLVGDIVDGTNVLRFNDDVTAELIAFIKTLAEFAPTFICYGSHDLACLYEGKLEKGASHWLVDQEAFFERLIDKVAGEKNVHVEEGTKDIGDGYTVSMYNPPLEYAMLKPDGDNRYLYRDSLKYDFLKKLDANYINVLLCHYPNAIRFLFEQGLLNNVDLGVAGHNHNGMTQIGLLEVFNKGNKGIITPGKSRDKEDTAEVKGVIELSDRTSLLINPAYTSLAACTGKLHSMDGLFYSGATEINFYPAEEEEEPLSRARTK